MTTCCFVTGGVSIWIPHQKIHRSERKEKSKKDNMGSGIGPSQCDILATERQSQGDSATPVQIPKLPVSGMLLWLGLQQEVQDRVSTQGFLSS